jgi:hypothetical protein
MMKTHSAGLESVSTSQRAKDSKIMFRKSARALIAHFLPHEGRHRQDELVEILRLTPRTARMAWCKVLRSIAERFDCFLTNKIRPSLAQLQKSLKADTDRSTEKLNSDLTLLDQSVDALRVALAVASMGEDEETG